MGDMTNRIDSWPLDMTKRSVRLMSIEEWSEQRIAKSCTTGD
jgi:hypothetical protein